MYEKDVSNRNYARRHHLTSSQELGIHVNPGDICYIDYGSEAYKLEMGLQHFGLVLTRERGKIYLPCDTLLFDGIKSKVIQIIKGE